jgi:hypothetical protein
MQSPDPAALAARWSEIVEHPVSRTATGEPQILLDLGTIRFVRDADGRGEGLGGVELRAAKPERIIDAATRRGCRVDGDVVTVCGTRFRLVTA